MSNLRRLLALSVTSALALPAAGAGQGLPETPTLPPEVVATDGVKTLHGHVSPRRSTHDARVRVFGSSPTAKRWFYTAQAELYRRHLAEEARTSDGRRFAVDPALFHSSALDGAVPGHIEICDPYLAAGAARNPYACGSGGRPADCYDVTVILAVNAPATDERRAAIELWSTPVKVTVRNPKTRNADVARVEVLGEPVRAPFTRAPKRSGSNLLEPVTSSDGRLLIANSGDTLLYSVMGDAATPCDARGWKKLSHLSRAPSDPAMARYGLARYPLRDTENRRIKAGRPIRGAYPWIDRAGKNLFFTQVGSAGLFYRDGEGELRRRFEVENRPRRREIELAGGTRFGMSWVGLWSEGKIVVPDTRVNNVDFHTGARDYRPRIRVYEGPGGHVELERAPIVDLNSPESGWNYRAALRTRQPRDVVWWLSASQGMTSEVVFDDSLDAGTLVYSPMNAAVDNKKRAYRDGFDAKRGGYVKAPRIQNAAASERRWALPRFGRLSGARVEPIAAGGVVAKGLWLDGSLGRLDYAIPAQTRAQEMTDAVWTTTLAIDPRGTGTRSRLLTFPDGSWVDLAGSRLLLGGAGATSSIELPAALAPAPRRWTHLAFVSEPGRVVVYVDGFRLATASGSWLRPAPGPLTVGAASTAETDPPASFRGWLDELRIASGERDPETICNWAGGTLAGADPADEAFATAGAYPAESHDAVSALLAATSRKTFERYRCVRRRAGGDSCLDAIHRFSGIPDRCVGPAVRFPEGPLFADLPRPDSRANANCRSCHVEGHPTPSLRLARPLRAGEPGTALADDARRQPRQAPTRIHGIVPRELLGLSEDLVAPLEGLLLDPFLYSSAKRGVGR